MQTISKLLTSFAISLLLIAGISCQSKDRFGNWNIATATTPKDSLSWAKFIWTNDSLGSRYFERTVMFIPAKIDGLPYNFLFQFDLGSNLTLLYGNPLQSIVAKHPAFNRMKNTKTSWLGKPEQLFKDLHLSFGNTRVSSENCFVMKGFGEQTPADRLTDSSTIRVGTIGADLFQNKILVLDYPNQRFAVCDTLPGHLQTTFVDISLDEQGRVLLPLQLKNKSYRVLFDNGSSIFPLLVSHNKANSFSTAEGRDTIQISSWGTTHNVIGRPLKGPFQLAGRTFSDVMIYADYRKEAQTIGYDAIAGNALFWNQVVIIDFKNRKFGVK